MPDDNTPIDVIVPLPGSGNQGDGTDKGDEVMPVDDTINKVLDQAYTQNHEMAMQQANRENAGVGVLMELSRDSFSAAAVQQVHLAGGILAQRSAQAQPQVMPGPGGTGVPVGMKLVPA